jgi:hypothetical protein
MEPSFRFLILILLSTATLTAGQIYGTLRVNGNGVSGATVRVTCAGETTPPATSEPDGSYRIYVASTGRCTFQVNYAQRTGDIEIFSSDNPIKYDFELAPAAPGRYTLNRK